MNGPAGFVTVVIADDHPLVLIGLEELLSTDSSIRLLARYTDGSSALTGIKTLRPDVAVLDVAIPGVNGLEVFFELRRARLSTKVIFLTASLGDGQVFDAVTGGIEGIVLKNTAPQMLLECIHEVYHGKRYLPKELVEPALAREIERREVGRRLIDSLTSKERIIAGFVAQGLPNKAISEQLGISEGTVKIHLHNIYSKIGVSNRTSLAAIAIRHSYVFDQRN